MANGGLAVLAGLGQAAGGLPNGMIAGQKLDQQQQQIDEMARHRKMIEDAATTDVGQLFTAIGLPTPAGLSGRVPNTVANTAAGQALKEQERRRALGQRENLAANLERMGQGTPAQTWSEPEGSAVTPGTPGDPRFASAARFARAGAGVDTLFKYLNPDHDKPMVVDKQVFDPKTGTFLAPPRPDPMNPAEIPAGTRPKLEVDQTGGQKKITYEYPPQPTGANIYETAVNALQEAEAKYPPGHPEIMKAQTRVNRLKPMIQPEGGAIVGPAGGNPMVAAPPKTSPLAAGEAATNADFRTFITDLKGLTQSYNPAWTGPVTGRMGALRNVTGLGITPDEADFRAQLASFQNRLLRLRSGAAVTPSEYSRILNELPQATDPEVVFRAKLGRATTEAEAALSNRETEFAARGFRGGESPIAAPAPAATPTRAVRWGRDAQGRPVPLP